MGKNNIKISIVVPAYNEGEIINLTIKQVKEVMLKLNYKYEIIVVDDGSRDKTKEILKKIEGIKVVSHPYNKGYGAALKTGAKYARGDYVFYIDADGQQYAEDIIKLINHIPAYDMVVGARTNIGSLFRVPAKKILNLVANYLAERKIPDINSGFRIIKRDIIMEFLHILPNTFSFTTTITLACIKSGYNVKYVPIKIKTRKKGRSTINPVKDLVRFFILLLRTTTLFSPLKVFLPASVILFFFGIAYIIYHIITYRNVTDTGIFFLVSSVMVFFFGLLSDQLSSIRRQIKK